MNARTTVCSIASLISLLGAAPLRAADAQPQLILLWPAGAPGSEGKSAPEAVRLTPDSDHVVSSVHHPSLTAYLSLEGSMTCHGSGSSRPWW